MKIAICYKTVLGTTKKYALWLTEKLGADVYTFSQIKDETLTPYDVVIVASGTYAGKMPLVPFLKKQWERLKEKKIIVLSIGMAPLSDPQSMASYEAIPHYIRENVLYFKLPGKFVKAGVMGEPSKEKLAPVFAAIAKIHR